jgi:hypothetical protein
MSFLTRLFNRDQDPNQPATDDEETAKAADGDNGAPAPAPAAAAKAPPPPRASSAVSPRQAPKPSKAQASAVPAKPSAAARANPTMSIALRTQKMATPTVKPSTAPPTTRMAALASAVAAPATGAVTPPSAAKLSAPTVEVKKPADAVARAHDDAHGDAHGEAGRLWRELDAAIDANTTPKSENGTAAHGVSNHADLAAVREVFDDVARNYLVQVRNLMLEVKWGEARAEWLSLCEPTLHSLRKMAGTMDMPSLCTALDGFVTVLHKVRQRCRGAVAGDDRDELLQAYDPLVATLPRAFELDNERNRREPIIVQALLRQVPAVEKVTIDKLYAAGLTSLALLYQAKPDEIAATSAITLDVATRIVELFQSYRRSSGGTMAAATAAEEQRRLGALVSELKHQHVAFEEAAAAWSKSALERKKELRRARQSTMLKIQVALARLGEVDRLAELEKLPFGRRIENVQSYLEHARSAARA